jgi:hypothetical protein
VCSENVVSTFRKYRECVVGVFHKPPRPEPEFAVRGFPQSLVRLLGDDLAVRFAVDKYVDKCMVIHRLWITL